MTGYEGQYCCLQCKHKYSVLQGMSRAHPKACPKCGHLWVEWLNYQTLKKQRGWGQY